MKRLSFHVSSCLTLLLAVSSSAQAQDLSAAVGKLASGELDAVQSGITELAQAGGPRALPTLVALQGRDVRVSPDKTRLCIQTDEGCADAITGAAVGDITGWQKPLVNNVIRRALKPAIAQLSLRDESRDVRLAAARELSDTPVPELRDSIVEAARAERDGEVKKALHFAVAVIDLRSAEDRHKLAAIAAVREAADVTLKGDLERLAEDPSQSAAVRKAASGALSAIDAKRLLIRIVGDLFYGLSLGSVLMLAALGLAITFGLMGVINMAHGEMLMIGAYATYAVQAWLGPGAVDYTLLVAVPVAFVVCTLIGVALERTVLRFLYGRPLETLLATWGISLALIQSVRLLFGAQNVAVTTPDWLAGGYEILGGVVLPYNRILIVAFTVVVVTALWATLNRTSLGLQVRAVTQNREMAAAMGIRTAQVDMWTFGLGSGLAGLGGVALSQIGNVGPELGQAYIVDSFMVVVLGGVGKLAGTVAGALGIGVVNKLLEPVSGAVFGKILVLGFIILFIQRRPQGLFAMRGRAAEA